MNSDLDDLVGTTASNHKRAAYPRKDHGGLHHLIGRALPYLCDAQGVANLHQLAEILKLTYAACHKWVRPGRSHKIPPKRAEEICKLSQEFADSGKAPKGFKPVTKADFLPFMF